MGEIETLVHESGGRLVSLLPWYLRPYQKVRLTVSGSLRHKLKVGAIGVVNEPCRLYNDQYVKGYRGKYSPLVQFQTIDGAEQGVYTVRGFGETLSLIIDDPNDIEIIED